LGSFASTFIPTGASAVTRAADVLTYPSAGNLAVLSPYTIYCEAMLEGINATGGGNWQVALASNLLYAPLLRISAGANVANFFSNTGDTFASSTGITQTNLIKYAAMRDATNIQIAFGGSISSTQPNGTETAEISSIQIGSMQGNANWLYGSIRNVRIYPTALSAAQLQALTTP
jgi:hypothetical protein